MGEHGDAFGNPPEGLGREREQCETKGTRGHFQRSFLTLLRSREIQTERQREPKRQTFLKGAPLADNEKATRLERQFWIQAEN